MKIKRIVSLVLAVLMVLGLVACGNSSKNTDKKNTDAAANTTANTASTQQSSEQTTGGLLFDKPITLSMMTMSHPSYPYQSDWWVWNAIKEATNVTLDVSAYGSAEYEDKLQLTMASGKLPDIMYLATKSVNKYALDGPFVDVISNLGKTPNFNKWYQSGEDTKDILKTYTSADGKVYVFPLVGAEIAMNKRGWLARKDVLQKNNLQIPTTYDELYTVLKELKKIYPDSYPLCFRDFFEGNMMFELFTNQWATGLDAYYDFDKNEWRYGPIEDNFKELITYFRKLYNENLIPPDILTIKTKGWTDLMSSSKSFFTLDYVVRIDYFNKPMQKENPDANLDLIAPPKGSVANGKAIMAKTNYAGGGDCVCKTSNSDSALKFVDWMYSDSAKEILNWGKEGVTYKVVNGERQYITDENSSGKEKLYGLMSFGVNLGSDINSVTLQYKGQTLDGFYKSEEYSEKYFNPKWWMDYTKEEKDVKLSIEETIKNRMQEYVSKFVTGEIGMDQWDNYVNGIKQLGVDKYLAVHESAYKRVK